MRRVYLDNNATTPVAPEVLEAYRVLEENEEFLGWRGKSNFGCCGPIGEISIIGSILLGLYRDDGAPPAW